MASTHTETLVSKAPPDELFELETDQWTEPYWQAAKNHKLVAPQCNSCGKMREMGAPFCHHCLSQDINWIELSGKGSIFSYTIIRFPLIESQKDCVPYVPAVIELEGAPGLKIISNVIGAPLPEIAISKAVSLCWHDRADGVSVARFTLDDTGGSHAN